ncbi:MAG: hypothetical protein NTV86_04055 [Planctomycetota bacterium]|nr:hypothetical protein [Planctomycetota bacterium]
MNQHANAAEPTPFSWSVLVATVLATVAVATLVLAAVFWSQQSARGAGPAHEQTVGWAILLGVALLAIAIGIYLLPPEHAKRLSLIQKCVVLSLLVHIVLVFSTRMAVVAKEMVVEAPSKQQIVIHSSSESAVVRELRRALSIDKDLRDLQADKRSEPVEIAKPLVARPESADPRAVKTEALAQANDLTAKAPEVGKGTEKGVKTEVVIEPGAPMPVEPLKTAAPLQQGETLVAGQGPQDLGKAFGATPGPRSEQLGIAVGTPPAIATNVPYSPTSGSPARAQNAGDAQNLATAQPGMDPAPISAAPALQTGSGQISASVREYADTVGGTGRVGSDNRLSGSTAGGGGGARVVGIAATPGQTGASSLAQAGAARIGAPGAVEQGAAPRAGDSPEGPANLIAGQVLKAAPMADPKAGGGDGLTPKGSDTPAALGQRLGEASAGGPGANRNVAIPSAPAAGSSDAGGPSTGGTGSGSGVSYVGQATGSGSAGTQRLGKADGEGTGGAGPKTGTVGYAGGSGSGVEVSGPIALAGAGGGAASGTGGGASGEGTGSGSGSGSGTGTGSGSGHGSGTGGGVGGGTGTGEGSGTLGQPGKREVSGTGTGGSGEGTGGGVVQVLAPVGGGVAGGSSLVGTASGSGNDGRGGFGGTAGGYGVVGGAGGKGGTGGGGGVGQGSGLGGKGLGGTGGTGIAPAGRPDVEFNPNVPVGFQGEAGGTGTGNRGGAGGVGGGDGTETGGAFAAGAGGRIAAGGGATGGGGGFGVGEGNLTGEVPLASVSNDSSARMAAPSARETPSDPSAPPLPVVTVFAAESLKPDTEYLTHRFKHDDKLMAKMGGNQATEAAVVSALEFLARSQEPNGRWTAFSGAPKPGSNGRADQDTALTGLATLCFLAAGHTPDQGRNPTATSAATAICTTTAWPASPSSSRPSCPTPPATRKPPPRPSASSSTPRTNVPAAGATAPATTATRASSAGR